MEEPVDVVERELGVTLPDVLRSVYRAGDGRFNNEGEWWVVWRLDQLVSENRGTRERGLPDTLIAFGDDGTGAPFCIRTGSRSSEVVRWNWIDSAVERSEGSMDDFLAAWVPDIE